MNLLFTFNTFADVFLCEKVATAAGLSCRAVAIPRSLDVTCEYAAEMRGIGENDIYAILELLQKNDLQYTRIFRSVSTAGGEMY
jgi:hypothetical protein